MSLNTNYNFCLSDLLSQKIKILLLAVFTFSSFNFFAQTSSLISACNDFIVEMLLLGNSRSYNFC